MLAGTFFKKRRGVRRRRVVWLSVGMRLEDEVSPMPSYHWSAQTKKAVWDKLTEEQKARVLGGLGVIYKVLLDASLHA